MKKFTINRYSGRRVLVIGDLHFDDVYEGKHLDYLKNTITVMTLIHNQIAKYRPDVVVLAGDIVGVRPGRSKVRTNIYRARIINFIKSLGPVVIALKGNHDFAEDADYNLMAETGVFVAPKKINYVADVIPGKNSEHNLRLHLLDYKQEEHKLELDTNEQAANIVIAHNEFYIENREYRRRSDDAIELVKHIPFFGTDMVLSGHIHEPSPQPETYTALDGNTQTFVNLGCPSRPSKAEKYNEVWFMMFDFDEEEMIWEPKPLIIELQNSDKVFNDDEGMFGDIEEQVDNFRAEHRERLDNVLDILLSKQPLNLDFKEQVQALSQASDEGKAKAIKYLETASNN